MKKKVAVFVPKPGNRIRYLLNNWLTKRIPSVEWLIISELETFKQSPHFKLNYSPVQLEEANAWVFPDGWMEDGTWRSIDYAQLNTGWVMFPQRNGDYAFDVFSAIFVMLTRAEEFLINTRDEHDRFLAAYASYPQGMSYAIPWVDVWLEHWCAYLNDKGLKLTINQSCSGLMTIDVDQVTAVYGKSLYKTIAGGVKHIKLISPHRRIQAYRNIIRDPFYSFPTLRSDAEKSGVPYHFFLLGGQQGNYDHNQDFSTPAYSSVIQELKEWATIGWHPGYYWQEKSLEEQKNEKEQLEQIIGKEITSVRMHFLKNNVQRCYLRLVELGITDDYTMGYPDQVGFRAGTSHPYAFYSLHLEQELPLQIHPLIAMDATFKWYLNHTPAQAVKLSEELIKYIISFGGEAVFLWHNHTVNDFGEWNQWSAVYQNQLNLLSSCLN